MGTHKPTRAPDNVRLSDFKLLAHAWEFAAAGDAFAKVDGFQSWMPLYFLYGRSMELAMKAFAIHKGATEKELRKRNEMWHDLVDCLRFVEARGFTMTPPLDAQERGSVELLNHWYSEKILEYPLVQAYTLPNPGVVRSIVDRIIGATCIAIHGAERYSFDKKRGRFRGLCPDPTIDWGGSVRWHEFAPSAPLGAS
jgi:hypothetical protein